MNIIIGIPDNYKDIFTVSEYECIRCEERNRYPSIRTHTSLYKSEERYGYPVISDFTNENKTDVLKISAKWCKHEGANYFRSCNDLDLVINVYVYDGMVFKFMQYYLSDFKRRENNGGYFPKYLHELR